MSRRPVGHASAAEPVTEFPRVPAGPAQGVAAPWQAVCTCGHFVTAHELTQSGRRTACCSGDQNGKCPCEDYQRADRQQEATR